MGRTVIVGISFGAGFLLLLLTSLAGVAFVVGSWASNPGTPKQTAVPIWIPPTGAQGALKEAQNAAKYGPVNLEAAKETKDGFLDRFRARRVAVSSPRVNYCQPQAYVNCQPIQQVQTVSRVVASQPNCLPCQQVTTQTVTRTVAQPVAKEQPVVNPFDLMLNGDSNCLPCQRQTDPRIEKKTGGFACSQCKRPQVGDQWHTDWREDGTPITFLCKSCESKMSREQKSAAYRQYAARQRAVEGARGLSFQEVQ